MFIISDESHLIKDDAQELANSLLKTSRLRAWITGTMSCGLMRPRKTYLVQMVSSVCGGNQVRTTKTSVSCLQSSMVVGVSWSGAAWVLPALGSYSSLREPWMPTCTVTYWSRAWSPPFRDWAPGQYSDIVTTPNTQDDHCLVKEAEGKGNLWVIFKRKVEECKVSNIHQLCDVVMEAMQGKASLFI